VTIGPGNAVFDTNGHDATLTGAISAGSGTTELHKIGAGTLTLTGNNTYIGQLQINAGTLILTGDNQPSITSTPISSGATLQIGNGGGTGSLTGNITNNGLFIINRSNAYTFGGAISGTGSFVQMGAGTTTLTATNTYSGGTTISAGTLAVSADANLGNTSGGLSFGGGTLQYLAGFTSNRGVTLNAGGGTFDTNGNDATLSGTIAARRPRQDRRRHVYPHRRQHLYRGHDDQRRHAADREWRPHRVDRRRYRQQRGAHIQPQ
jgi:autotransporter-associated beta strand protein